MKTIARFPTLFVVAFLLILPGCKKESTEDEWKLNQQKWEKLAVNTYSFHYSHYCECINPGVYKVDVVNNAVATVTSLQTGAATDPVHFSTISELFTFVKESLAKKPVTASVSYNKEYGFPESISFDFDKKMVDDEISIQVNTVQWAGRRAAP